ARQRAAAATSTSAGTPAGTASGATTSNAPGWPASARSRRASATAAAHASGSSCHGTQPSASRAARRTAARELPPTQMGGRGRCLAPAREVGRGGLVAPRAAPLEAGAQHFERGPEGPAPRARDRAPAGGRVGGAILLRDQGGVAVGRDEDVGEEADARRGAGH